MNKISNEYKLLFLEMCRGLQITAENARDAHVDEADYQLKEDARALEDKIEQDELLTANDIRTLYLCSMISQMLISKQIKRLQISLEGYQKLLDPKLKQIIDERITDKQTILKMFLIEE